MSVHVDPGCWIADLVITEEKSSKTMLVRISSDTLPSTITQRYCRFPAKGKLIRKTKTNECGSRDAIAGLRFRIQSRVPSDQGAVWFVFFDVEGDGGS